MKGAEIINCNICGKNPSIGKIVRRMPNNAEIEFYPCPNCMSISERYLYTVCMNCDSDSWTEKEYAGKIEKRVFGRRFEVYLIGSCMICDNSQKNKLPV